MKKLSVTVTFENSQQKTVSSRAIKLLVGKKECHPLKLYIQRKFLGLHSRNGSPEEPETNGEKKIICEGSNGLNWAVFYYPVKSEGPL